MTKFALAVPVYSGPSSYVTYGKHPKMVLKTASGKLDLIVPYAPTGGQFGNRAASFQITQRAGRLPLVERNYLPLATVNYTLFLGSPDLTQSVEPLMRRLDTMAQGTEPIICTFGPTDGGYWYITTLEYDVQQRKFGTNEVVRCNATLGLTRATGVAAATGPVSGGVKPATTPKPAGGAHSPSKPAAATPRTYVVKKGDTLSGIAASQLHNAGRWHEIANLNGIRDPRKLKVGARLKLPT